MPDQRVVRLFKNGRNQAIRIPREFELPGDEVVLRKDGNRLILEPIPKKTLTELLAELRPIEDEFAPIEELPIEEVEPVTRYLLDTNRVQTSSATPGT